jgi:thiamine biosynthesis lipoprotein
MADAVFEFPCMGVRVQLRIGPPRDPSGPDPQRSAATARAALEELDRTLTRFSDESELSALNADPRRVVPASGVLCGAVQAALDVARSSRGLVDPTLLAPLRRAGYETTMRDVASAPLRDALATAPPRRAGRPNPNRAWAQVKVDVAAGTITRPPGVGIDLGGSAKGLAADLVGRALETHQRYIVDMAGDLAVGRPDPTAEPYSVGIVEPFDDRVVHEIEIAGGGIATSGVGSRLWRDGAADTRTTCSTRPPESRHGPAWCSQPRWRRPRSRRRRWPSRRSWAVPAPLAGCSHAMED